MEAFEITDVLRTLDELPHRRELVDSDDGNEDEQTFIEMRFADMGFDERYRIQRVLDDLRRLFTVAEAREAGAVKIV